jgi:hypothetical protein
MSFREFNLRPDPANEVTYANRDRIGPAAAAPRPSVPDRRPGRSSFWAGALHHPRPWRDYVDEVHDPCREPAP